VGGARFGSLKEQIIGEGSHSDYVVSLGEKKTSDIQLSKREM